MRRREDVTETPQRCRAVVEETALAPTIPSVYTWRGIARAGHSMLRGPYAWTPIAPVARIARMARVGRIARMRGTVFG